MSIPRIPLHLQNADINKAAKTNPSYESFRPNIIHHSSYREMEGRAGVNDQNRVRRYLDGRLDFMWIANQIIDAIHNVEYNNVILPIEQALLSVVFPLKYAKMEPQQAELLTQLTASEKGALKALVEKQLADEQNWAAGQGGGSTPGSRLNNVGG
jgi:hypothetical protein